MTTPSLLRQLARRWQLSALLAVGLLLVGWGQWHYAHRSAGLSLDERNQLKASNSQLQQQLRDSRVEARKLGQQLAYAEQMRQMEVQNTTALKLAVAEGEKELGNLREQLNQYKSSAKPDSARAGVRVQDLTVRRVGELWQYNLVLIQSVREENRIAGTATLTLDAAVGKAKRSYPLATLIKSGDRNLVFSFKYYDEFSGTFALPSNAQPIGLTVSLKAADKRPVANESFQWPSIVRTNAVP